MAEAIEMMGLMTAFGAALSVVAISRVRANEYIEFAGSVAHRPMSAKS